MSKYKVNPKTKGSGVIAAIPQTGRCPIQCEDCFFQSGRSFLEPLDENLPNMPSFEQSIGRVVRVNDGNDSNNGQQQVLESTAMYQMKFYNTSIPKRLENFVDPVVLTINPGKMTDVEFYKLDPIPKNLMFVRIRTNMWNLVDVVIPAVNYYTKHEVPVVLTFMAYYDTQDKIPAGFKDCYIFKKRTLNSYYVLKQYHWTNIMLLFKDIKYVHSCGKDANTYPCKFCGNCIREYHVTKLRISGRDL